MDMERNKNYGDNDARKTWFSCSSCPLPV